VAYKESRTSDENIFEQGGQKFRTVKWWPFKKTRATDEIKELEEKFTARFTARFEALAAEIKDLQENVQKQEAAIQARFEKQEAAIQKQEARIQQIEDWQRRVDERREIDTKFEKNVLDKDWCCGAGVGQLAQHVPTSCGNEKNSNVAGVERRGEESIPKSQDLVYRRHQQIGHRREQC